MAYKNILKNAVAQNYFIQFCKSVGAISYRICLVIRQNLFLPKQSQKSRSRSYKTDLDLWGCLGRKKIVL